MKESGNVGCHSQLRLGADILSCLSAFYWQKGKRISGMGSIFCLGWENLQSDMAKIMDTGRGETVGQSFSVKCVIVY